MPIALVRALYLISDCDDSTFSSALLVSSLLPTFTTATNTPDARNVWHFHCTMVSAINGGGRIGALTSFLTHCAIRPGPSVEVFWVEIAMHLVIDCGTIQSGTSLSASLWDEIVGYNYLVNGIGFDLSNIITLGDPNIFPMLNVIPGPLWFRLRGTGDLYSFASFNPLD
ncbi:hypothetical protein F5141DRAFT_1204757 [Pisolithus sp. B1]|nr:hypothetical protein F5141DRAFT_1204757 [Pisolithus sp. B1]